MQDLKQLRKIITLCRALGVQIYETPEFKITLASNPPAPRTRQKRKQPLNTPSKSKIDSNEAELNQVLTDSGLSKEDLLFWSVGGPPNDSNSPGEIQ